MRILGVRFKNLNSLVGEWQIDFTHPAYASDGIFAITGPTGAGKTTIMDAVCLALYGSTPRLGKVTKSGNEIMSRQTGECFAEVTFETGKGRYRCHWSQRRAHKKPDGELQQARHEIADADSGQVLESKINQVGEFIETVTGMDFGRFTQSMLLAQGGFAAFLKASPNERSPILEQITGTEIYSQISILVHERRATEQEKLRLLEAELKGIRILGEEEERELQNRLKEKQGREAELAGQLKELPRALAWLQRMAALEKELAELEKLRQDFIAQWEGFVPDARRLEKAKKAQELEGDYRSVKVLRDMQAKETEELQSAQTLLPEKEKALAATVAARSAAEGLLKEAQNKQTAEGRSSRRSGISMSGWTNRASNSPGAIRRLRSSKSRQRPVRAASKMDGQELKKVDGSLEKLQEYRAKHAADGLLVAQFPVIERGLAGLQALEVKHDKTMAALSEATRKQEAARAALAAKEQDHEKARLEFEKQQTELKQPCR